MWAMEKLDFDLGMTQRNLQLTGLEEIKNNAYESSKIYKEKTKPFHDRKILEKIT